MPNSSSIMTGARLLYLGCEPGEDVLDLQDMLNAVAGAVGHASGYARLVVDGIFGQKTMARTMEFQRCNGLTADGCVGPMTWSELLTLLSATPGLEAKQINGGAGYGPAKGLSGESVFGKPMPSGEKQVSSGMQTSSEVGIKFFPGQTPDVMWKVRPKVTPKVTPR